MFQNTWKTFFQPKRKRSMRKCVCITKTHRQMLFFKTLSTTQSKQKTTNKLSLRKLTRNSTELLSTAFRECDSKSDWTQREGQLLSTCWASKHRPTTKTSPSCMKLPTKVFNLQNRICLRETFKLNFFSLTKEETSLEP